MFGTKNSRKQVIQKLHSQKRVILFLFLPILAYNANHHSGKYEIFHRVIHTVLTVLVRSRRKKQSKSATNEIIDFESENSHIENLWFTKSNKHQKYIQIHYTDCYNRMVKHTQIRRNFQRFNSSVEYFLLQPQETRLNELSLCSAGLC